MSCCAGAFLALSLAVLAAPDVNDIAAVEQRVLANRLAMQKWQIRVTFAIDDQSAPREPDAPTATGYTCYVDGDRMRVDSTYRYVKKPPGVDNDFFTDTTIWGDNDYITYSTRRFEDGATVTLDVADRNWSLKHESIGQIRLPAIQTIGMLPGGLLIHQPITTCIGNPNRTELRMSDDAVNDIECKKISFVSEAGLPTRVWVAPALGYSVVRLEHDWKAEPHNYLDRTDVAVTEHQKTGIWFPASAEWVRIQDGNDTTMREKVEVQILSLNEPLNPNLFTIGDVNVPVGTFVNRRPWVGKFIWDGKQIQEENPAAVLNEKANHVGISGRRIALLGTTLLLAVLCGVFLWRHFVRQ